MSRPLIGALGQVELQACALDQWAAHRMVSPSRSARSSSSLVLVKSSRLVTGYVTVHWSTVVEPLHVPGSCQH